MFLSMVTHITRPELLYYLKSVGREELMSFILDLDEAVADFEFTTELYARLGDALREELESDG